MQLRPVTYQFDARSFSGDSTNDVMFNEAMSVRRSGFIAQEVEEAAKKAGYNFSGLIKPNKEQKHYSLSYESFVVPLVKAVQEQQGLIIEQQKKVAAQQTTIDQQSKEIAELKKEIGDIKKYLVRVNTNNK